MTSLNNIFTILGLFKLNRPTLTLDTIANELQLSRASVYRYLKELCEFGLMSRVNGHYALGPRIIELDWLMRS